MEIQTRSCEGELKTFSSFREALKFANEKNRQAKAAFDASIPLDDIDPVAKISFSLPTGERIRLIYEGDKWVLRQMEDEIAKVLHP